MSKLNYKAISLVIGLIAFSFLFVWYIFAFTEPTTTPPGGNVPAPLNVGTANQIKAGGLGISGGFFVDSPTFVVDAVNDRIGIGTTTPDSNYKLDVAGTVIANDFCTRTGKCLSDSFNGPGGNWWCYPILSASFSVAGQDTDSQGLAFNDNGTKMYVAGSNNNRVYQYTLSTAWDISTASYDNINLILFWVFGQDPAPKALAFKPDGRKMYVLQEAPSRRVSQYSLPTPWSLSGASFDNAIFSVGGQDLNPDGLAFKPDGRKMYVLGSTNEFVYQYTLSTAWDISTASYDNVSFEVRDPYTNPRLLAFKPDGTKMYVYLLGGVRQYSLPTPWSLSGASFDNVSMSLSGNTNDLAFKPDGTKMYVLGGTAVYQYSFSCQ